MLFPRASGQGLGQIPLSAIKSYELVVFKPLGHVPFPFCPGMSRLASVFPEAISAGAGSAPAMAGVMWGDWIPQLPTGGPKSSGSKGSTSWAVPVPDISVAILGLPRNQGTWIYHLGIKGSLGSPSHSRKQNTTGVGLAMARVSGLCRSHTVPNPTQSHC